MMGLNSINPNTTLSFLCPYGYVKKKAKNLYSRIYQTEEEIIHWFSDRMDSMSYQIYSSLQLFQM